MKEDCLFGLEHLFCALAGNRNENEMFLLHDNTMFKNLKTTLTTFPLGDNTPQRPGALCGRVSIIMLQKMYAQQGFCAYILGLKAKICTLLYL